MADHSQMKLGRPGVKHDARTFKLAKYLKVTLPPPPDFADFTQGIKQWGVMGNDRLGDCTIAGVGHQIQLWTLNTASMVTEPDDVVISYYSKWDGYTPGNPASDNGGYEIDVLNKWRAEGFANHGLLAYADPDPQDLVHVKQAIALFSGLYIGLALPVSAQSQDVWDAVANDGGPWGGHCVCVCGYNTVGPVCITWGEVKQMTWAFWQKYCDEAHALLSQDWLAHFYLGESNVDLQALMNDLQALAG